MELTVKQKNVLLYFTQAVGIVFVTLFLTAYFGGRVLGGLSSTATLNNDPNFVLSQSIIGVLFILCVTATLVFAALTKQKNEKIPKENNN